MSVPSQEKTQESAAKCYRLNQTLNVGKPTAGSRPLKCKCLSRALLSCFVPLSLEVNVEGTGPVWDSVASYAMSQCLL